MFFAFLKFTLLAIISFKQGYTLHTKSHRNAEEKITFALIPKLTTNPFFTVAQEGCIDKAKELGVECYYVGPEFEDPEAQNAIVRELVKNGTVDGIAISVSNADIVSKSINEAIDAGIPVITFDSDAPNSKRISYIGTDNQAFGDQLAKVLMLLDPEGGKYGKYGFVSGAGPNLAQRVEGFNLQMNSIDAFKSDWTEVKPGSPTDCQDNIDIALGQCYDFADNPDVRAIVPVGGWPMWKPEPWKEFVNAYKAKNLSLVVADALDVQIELLTQGYCDGLVGQLPYEMGTLSMETLNDIVVKNKETNTEITGTNLLQVLRVPINLPVIDLNNNYIGNLRPAGIALYALIGLTSITFLVISIIFRRERVIRSSSFPFISMICLGTLICGSFMITTAIDDEYYSQKSCDIACKLSPWLLTIGFNIYFSGLFGKTFTVFLHMRKNQYQEERVVAGFKEVYLPLVVAIAVNLIVLICWTFVSPLFYDRQPLPGTDPWNRIIATSGRCTSHNSHSVIFSSVLYAFALIYILVACGMAYNIRHVTTEYSESLYIALAIGATLESLVIGAPVMILTKSKTRTFYFVGMVLSFIVCMTTLCLIFIPKIIAIKTKAEPYIDDSSPKKRSVLDSIATGDGLTVSNERNVKLRFLPSNTDQIPN